MEFEWDPFKEASNVAKHGVSFHDAAKVFDDDLATTFPDPDHSYREHRFIMIGQSASGDVLVVTFTERGDTIRIISARHATKRERRFYEEG